MHPELEQIVQRLWNKWKQIWPSSMTKAVTQCGDASQIQSCAVCLRGMRSAT